MIGVVFVPPRFHRKKLLIPMVDKSKAEWFKGFPELWRHEQQKRRPGFMLKGSLRINGL